MIREALPTLAFLLLAVGVAVVRLWLAGPQDPTPGNPFPTPWPPGPGGPSNTPNARTAGVFRTGRRI